MALLQPSPTRQVLEARPHSTSLRPIFGPASCASSTTSCRDRDRLIEVTNASPGGDPISLGQRKLIRPCSLENSRTSGADRAAGTRLGQLAFGFGSKESAETQMVGRSPAMEI